MIVRVAILVEFKGLEGMYLFVGKEGDRHHNLFHDYLIGPSYTTECIQGFVDDTGKFYNRENAAKHAIECKQVVVGIANIPRESDVGPGKYVFDGETLYSEDLW